MALSFILISFIFFFSFIFCHFLSLFLVLLLFSGAQNPLFLPRLPHDFLFKLLCKKSFFWAVSGGCTIGPLSFFLSSNFHVFSIFVFFFNFFPCFGFSFVLPFFHVLFLFLLFKNVSSFFILFLFFLFLGAQNLWRHSRIPWRKVHILSWLYLLCIGSSSLFPVE